MADWKKEEKRRRQLKLRAATERDEINREEARWLDKNAAWALKNGDLAGAERLAKRVLALVHNDAGALDLLATVYARAGRYSDALYYSGLLRKVRPDLPGAIFNTAVAKMKLGRNREALADFYEFLAAAKSLREPRWMELKASAAEQARELAASEKKPAPAPPESAPPAAPEPALQPPKPNAPSVSLTFLPSPEPDFTAERPGRLVDFLLRQGLIELRMGQSFENLVCLASLNGVDAYAHQQDTVRRVLRHFKGRALLADEVGLGKTIEACLVLKEYWARGMVRRALILTPPSLVPQWKGELSEKFGFSPSSPDSAAFRSAPEQFWRQEPLVVASIATARLEPHASVLAETAWDMVIVDEAHCLKNRTSANWKLVNSLQKRFILMLTATPVENHLVELYNLITVLKPGLLSTETEFKQQFVTTGRPRTPKNPDRLRALLGEVMVRNTRSVMETPLPPRIAATVTVAPAEAEARLYEAVSDFVARQHRENKAPGSALELLQRQAGSSPQALLRSVSRMLRDSGWLTPDGRAELEDIQELASTIPVGGKGAQLASMLAEHSGKVVVFTEFLPTLEYLAHLLDRSGIPYAVFSGELSRAEKDAAIARFRDDVDLLISTGVGGEGRNLQFANTVINFDLPWNPMRIEQRVGRVHRIGQTKEVFVFNFCQAGSVEEQLLRLLHDKINMFELVVGEIDAILGSLDESRDFAGVVLDLWLAARETGRVHEAFDELAETLLAAKKQYARTKQLDDALFERDFEA